MIPTIEIMQAETPMPDPDESPVTCDENCSGLDNSSDGQCKYGWNDDSYDCVPDPNKCPGKPGFTLTYELNPVGTAGKLEKAEARIADLRAVALELLEYWETNELGYIIPAQDRRE